MKARPHILVLVLGAASFVSLPAQKSAYDLPFENTRKLPPLDAFINTEEMGLTYQTTTEVFTTEFSGPDQEGTLQTSRAHLNDPQALDAYRLLDRYMQDQLMESGPDSRGSVEMKITYLQQKGRISPGSILAVVTFGIGPILGVPFAAVVTDVEIQADFFDENGDHLSTYRGVGHASRPEGFYSSNEHRQCHLNALKKALTDLNARIQTDLLQERPGLPSVANL
ncbi:MAG: hypothetical protein R2751_17145 [Bacteroidales bacterium]